MLTLYVSLIEGGTIALSWIQSGYLPHHALAVLGLVWLQAVVLLSVTMAASTWFSSLTSGAVSLGLYGLAFVGMDRAVWALRHVRALVDLEMISS